MIRRVPVDVHLEGDTVAGTLELVTEVCVTDDDEPVTVQRQDLTASLSAATQEKLQAMFAEDPPEPWDSDVESEALTEASGDPAARRPKGGPK